MVIFMTTWWSGVGWVLWIFQDEQLFKMKTLAKDMILDQLYCFVFVTKVLAGLISQGTISCLCNYFLFTVTHCLLGFICILQERKLYPIVTIRKLSALQCNRFCRKLRHICDKTRFSSQISSQQP